MNSVFHFRGSVPVRPANEPRRIPNTLHLLRKALRPNPWGLTPREVEVMDALLKFDSQKRVCAELGIVRRTLETLIATARERMGAQGTYRYLLKWQEFRIRGEMEKAA